MSGSTAGDLRLWDGKHGHGKCLVTLPEAHDLGVLSSDFSSRYEINGKIKFLTGKINLH